MKQAKMKTRLYSSKQVSRPVSREAGIVVIVGVLLSMVALAIFSATLPV